MPGCGSSAGYTAHTERGEAHCQPCKDAKAAWMRRYKIRTYLAKGNMRVDAAGVRRRLHALQRMGWSYTHLAPRFGVSYQAVASWADEATVYRSTVERVRAVYDELWDQPGPSVIARQRAERKGWAPPLAWDDDTIDDPRARPVGIGSWERAGGAIDEIAVHRAVHGDRVYLRPVERAEAVRRLRAQGMSGRQIAERLGIAARSVDRIRATDRRAG